MCTVSKTWMKKKLPWSLFLPSQIVNWRRRKHSGSRSPHHGHRSRLRSRSRTRSKSRHHHRSRSRSRSHDRGGHQDRYWFYTNVKEALTKLVLLSGMCLGTATSNKCKVRWTVACDEKIVTLADHIQVHGVEVGKCRANSEFGLSESTRMAYNAFTRKT